MKIIRDLYKDTSLNKLIKIFVVMIMFYSVIDIAYEVSINNSLFPGEETINYSIIIGLLSLFGILNNIGLIICSSALVSRYLQDKNKYNVLISVVSSVTLVIVSILLIRIVILPVFYNIFINIVFVEYRIDFARLPFELERISLFKFFSSDVYSYEIELINSISTNMGLLDNVQVVLVFLRSIILSISDIICIIISIFMCVKHKGGMSNAD